MKSYVIVAAVAMQTLIMHPAVCQTLTPIDGKLLAFSSLIAPASTTIISSVGPLAITSAEFSYFGTKPSYVYVQRAIYTGANCTGLTKTVGKSFYVAVQAYQTVQLTYPTPLAFFPDASNLVCILVVNSGDSNLAITFVGYTQ